MATRRVTFDEVERILKSRGVELGDFPAPGANRQGNPVHYVVHDGPARLDALRLDEGEAPWERAHMIEGDRIAGFVVDGDLAIDGNLLNGEMDFGPCLIVLGDLRVTHAAVSGATIFVSGNVHARVFHGYYNHGYLEVRGNVEVDALVASDYFGKIGGTIRALLLKDGSIEHGEHLPGERRTARELFVDEVFVPLEPEEDEDDDDDEYDEDEVEEERPHDGKLFDRLEQGLAVLRGGPTTAPLPLR